MDLPHNALLIHINTPQCFCTPGSETSASTYANMFQGFRTKVMLIPIHPIALSAELELQGHYSTVVRLLHLCYKTWLPMCLDLHYVFMCYTH